MTSPGATPLSPAKANGGTTTSTPAKPAEPRRTKQPPDEDDEWLTNNTGWLNNKVLTPGNTMLGEVNRVLERNTVGQWENLSKATEPRMVDTIEQLGEALFKLAARLRKPAEHEADKLMQQDRVKRTPARRASAPVQPPAS
jgi:hypothetical protein